MFSNYPVLSCYPLIRNNWLKIENRDGRVHLFQYRKRFIMSVTPSIACDKWVVAVQFIESAFIILIGRDPFFG